MPPSETSTTLASSGGGPTRVFMDIKGVLDIAPLDGAEPPLWWSRRSWRVGRRFYLASIKREIEVTWSTTVIKALREMAALPDTEMWWACEWGPEARVFYGSLFGIGRNWPVIPTWSEPEELPPDSPRWWKAQAPRAAIDAGMRVVWVDDMIAEYRLHLTLHGFHDDLAWLQNPNVIAVSPAHHLGLSPTDRDAIIRFILTGSPAF